MRDARNDETQQQLPLRPDLVAACVSEECVKYIPESVRVTIKDDAH